MRAKVLARRGNRTAALELAEAAVAQLRRADAVVWQADASVDLAETRLLLADAAGAEAAISDAVALDRLKGSEVAAERARSVASLAVRKL